MLVVLLACSDYQYATKAGHDAGDTDGAPWGWEDTDGDGPGGVEEGLDEFVVEGTHATDFVFFGDTSNTMTEELATLGGKMEEFVGVLDDAQVDWQLAAVTGPSGCAVGGVLDRTMPDVAATFAAAILTPPGEDLVDEWGLYNVAMAVENSDTGECNEGLLRRTATLHAIFLSDENDDSPGSADGVADYWQAYVDQIVAKEGAVEDVMLSAIIGPVPDGCAGAEPGYGYAEAVEATGGELISLCDDWVEQVTVLATEAVTQSRFPLSQDPIDGTVEVRVDGAEVDGTWMYFASGNYVEFLMSPPVTGQVVEVHYLVRQ